MAEKLLKSLEALKSSSVAATAPLGGQDQNRHEKVLGEQEKINHMNTVAELICSVSVRTSTDFVRLLTASMESILLYCSDRNATVRLNANESLNRMIVGLKESAITRVLWELFKEIKRNTRARSLAAALSRFGELCHLIKASKCRSYVGHLLPSVGRALKRDDELVQETLAAAMVRICPVLAPYMTESELQTLVKSFLSKLHSTSAATRRTASSSLALLCQYARKQKMTLELLLNGLLNAASPRFGEDPSSSSVIGALSCIRQLVPQLARPVKEDQGIADSFGVAVEDLPVNESMPSLSPVISRQIHKLYELVLRCSNHQNHNIVSASLEALHQILSNPPNILATFLTSQKGGLSEEESTEDKQSDSSEQVQSVWEGDKEWEPSVEIDEQKMGESEEDSLVWPEGSLSLYELDEDDGHGDGKLRQDIEELEHSESRESSTLDSREDQTVVISEGKSFQSTVDEPDFDSCHESEDQIPLAHCVLHVCSAFLLPGSAGNLTSDKIVRVSIKALAVRCVAAAVRLYPKCFLLQLKSKHLDSDQEAGPPQFISDVLLYVAHSDPLLRGEIAMLIGSLVLANLQESRLHFQSCESQVCDDYEPLQMGQLVDLLGKCLGDESTVSRMACSAVKLCLPTLLSSSNGNLGLKLLLKLLDLGKTSYWLVKVELAAVASCIDYKVVAYLQQLEMQLQASSYVLAKDNMTSGIDIQQRMLDVLVEQLNDEDFRVRRAVSCAFVHVIPRLFFSSKDWNKEALVAFGAELANYAYPSTVNLEAATQPSLSTGQWKSKQHDCSVIEVNLGRVVHLLSTAFLKMNPKQSVMGCCQTLNLLADNFPVISYPKAWSCRQVSLPVGPSTPVTPTPSTSGPLEEMSPPPTSAAEPSKLGPLSLLKLQLKKATPVVSSTDASAKVGTASYKASTEETKTSFVRASSLVPSGRGVEGASSLLSQFAAKNRKMLNKGQRPICGGPLTVALSLLKSSFSLDLQAHQDIILLCAKLLHGCGVYALLNSGTKTVTKVEGTDFQWIGLKDRQLVPLMEQLLTHLFRLLNVLCHVMEDKEPRPPEIKIRDRLLPGPGPSTGPGTSPKKKGKASEKDSKTSQSDGEKEKTGKTVKNKDGETESTTREKSIMGSFHQLPYYNTLYESLKGSFGNYKVTVDSSVPEKFGSMLKAALKALALVLELTCVEDIGKYTGEIIGYMCTTVQFCPSETYFCVEQLLNALFGANPAAQPGAIQSHLCSPYQPNITSCSPSVYDVCIIQPSVWLQNQVSDIKTTARHFENMRAEDRLSSSSFLKWVKGRRRKGTWTFVGRLDVGPIVKYIGAFEPLVIRSLRQYTGTGDADLQRRILQLLIQLIRLRVNYSMLDAEQAFLKYVISQVEHIEDGHVRDSASLIPYIFRFLVLLSYERSQSSAMNVPRLIQLCDGVMAGGLAAEDYTIPSLRPVVYDLFVARNSSSAEPDMKLETQREVIVSILNRIVQHHEVLSMLVTVLQTSRNSLNKWIDHSRMIMSSLVPRLRQQQVDLESHSALATLHLLFASLATCVVRPISQLVGLVLKQPIRKESRGLARWLSGVLVSLRVIVAVCSESELLKEIGQADAESWLTDVCPLLGCCPRDDSSDIFAWNLFGLVNFQVNALQPHLLLHQHVGIMEEFLCELIIQFILMIRLVLETFPAVLVASKRICQQLEGMFKDLNSKFFLLMSYQPLLVTSWCHLLSLIEYQSEWWDYLSAPLLSPPKLPIQSNLESGTANEEQHYRTTQTQDLSLYPSISSEPLGVRWRLVKDVALAIRSEQVVKLGAEDLISDFIRFTACDLACLQDEKPVVELLKTVQANCQLSGTFMKCLCNKLTTDLPLNLKKKMIVCFQFIHPSCTATVLRFLLGTIRCCALMPSVEAVCTSLMERLTKVHHQDGQLYVSSDEVIELRKAALAARRPSVKFRELEKLLNYQVALLQNESIDSAHFPSAGSQRPMEPTTDLEKFAQYVTDMCINHRSPPSTCQAHLLHCLSYNAILKILRHEQFDLYLLKFCISLGAQDTIRLLARQGNFEEYELEVEHIGLDTSEYFDEHGIDHLLDASRIVMFEQMEQLVSQQKQSHCTPGSGPTALLPCQLTADDQLSIVPLASALFTYLGYVSDIPKADIPNSGIEWIPDVSLDCLKHAFWLWQKIPSEDIISLLNCSAKTLENRGICIVLCKSDHSQWCYQFVDTLFEFVQSLLSESQTLLIQTVQAPEASYMNTVESGTDCTTQVHERICSLVHWLNGNQCLAVPQSVLRPLQSLVISLARLTALELHARIPAALMGRVSAIGGDGGSVPTTSISSEDLRDEDVLNDYVARVLTLGWRNRQQFEVTWVTLQGLLSPPAPLDELPDEETVEVYKVTCIAVRAITSLLIQTLLAPTPGHPAGNQLLHVSRQKELPFLGSRAGKKLLALRSVIELSLADTSSKCESTLPIFRSNTERPLGSCQYGSGQLNVTSLQVRVVTSDVRSVEDQTDDESNSRMAAFSINSHQVVEMVDVKSCLQLLLELFAQWLDTSVSPRAPVMLIFEIMKSAVILSDVFEEFWHFQWLLEHCLRLAAVNMSEDEQILQYLILGACKAAAVLRNEQYAERVAKLALLGLSAAQESTKVLTLHGILYILEAHAGADMKILLPSLSDHVISLLLQTACGEVRICPEYQLTLWSTAFFLVEQYSDDLKLTDFSARVVKVALVFLSAGDVVPLPVYSAVIRCLERLLLSFTLSKSDREAVSKVALERYDNLTVKQSLPALGLLLTYLYTGRSADQASGISQLESETLNDPGMEGQLAVLEKITKILDRMHKALPAEATVVAGILPSLLQDFMPRYQIMTKVVGEFLSSQQPYPGLMAEVMFKVFENLIQKKELGFVTEWVLLSLGSVIQRTPLAMAVWSLNCLFVCSSLNGPMRAQFPCLLERIGQFEDLDGELLATVCEEFYHSRNLDDNQRKSIVGVFRSAAIDHEVYRGVVSRLEKDT